MLRALARHVRSLKVVSDAAPAAFSMRHMSSGHDEEEDAKPRTGPVPTVFDKLVSFTVIDLTGKRHTVRGLQGKNLSEVLQEHGFPRTYFFPNMGFYTQVRHRSTSPGSAVLHIYRHDLQTCKSCMLVTYTLFG